LAKVGFQGQDCLPKKQSAFFCAQFAPPPPFKFVATNPLGQVLSAYIGWRVLHKPVYSLQVA
jgi:hypothetical protein